MVAPTVCFPKVFVPWGVGLDVVDITDTAAVSAALSQKQYRYIWVENPV